MKFKRLLLRFFQGHHKSDIRFHKWLNVITGPSDSGKSSIIRGFKLLILNRPQGNSYRTHNKKRTIVKASDGTNTVQRTKTDSVNEYIVNGISSKAVKTDVPSDVFAALNLAEVNIQEQKDHFFLLNDSPGKVSKKLNNVAGLSEMDETLKAINSDIRAANTKIRYDNERLGTLQTEIDSLEWITSADELYQKIEQLMDEQQERQRTYNELVSLVDQLKAARRAKKKLLPVSFEVDLNKIIALRDQIDGLKLKHDELLSIKTRLKDLTHEFNTTAVIDISVIESLYADLLKKIEMYRWLTSLQQQFDSAKNQLAEADKDLHSTLMELEKIKVCPECRRPL